MPRLLLWSDSVCASTGFGRVARTICGALPDWEITQVGLNHPGLDTEDERVKIHVAPSDDPVGVNLTKELYLTQDFDLFIIVQDLHIMNPWAGPFATMRATRQLRNEKRTPALYHFPVDGPMLGDVEFCRFADYNVSCTQWGAEVLAPHLPITSVDVIPHAVDTNVFTQLDADIRAELRQRIFGIDPQDNTLAVLSVGVNSDRKDHFTALSAIKELNKDRVQGKLYLHTDASAHGMDLYCQARSLGLSSIDYRIADATLLGCSDDGLNDLYNAADCLLFTSRREGFGIPMIEAMAANTPVLAPNYGPFAEVLAGGKFGYLHMPNGLTWLRGDNRGPSWQSDAGAVARHLAFIRAAIAAEGAASGIKRGRNEVNRRYSLDVVTPLWQEYIQGILDGS